MVSPQDKPKRPQRITVNTRDGWKLALYRHQTGKWTSPWGPVLLVHGLGTNRYNLDAPFPQISLASFLHDRGHDVWVAELRGAGRSRPALWPIQRRRQYDFDDYVHRDVPALMRAVLDRTGSPSLHWVGHSMGGMLAYAALEHYDQALFRSVVTIASPAFTSMKHPAVDKLYRLTPLLTIIPWVPYSILGKAISLFPRLATQTMGRVMANPKHMEPDHVRFLARHTIHDLPSMLLRQFGWWYGVSYGFSRSDGLLDYYRHLSRITVPMMIIAGAGDLLTPIEDLRFVYEAIASRDKEFVLCGRKQGFCLNYGHVDLILGTRARDEVYPHIARWVERHA